MFHNVTNLPRPVIACGALFLILTLACLHPLQAQKKKKSVSPARTEVTPSLVSERMLGYEKKKALETGSRLVDASFRNIGPSIMSGRVVDQEVNPEDPTEFYVAYATGGLWHTTNNGLSFSPIFDSTEVIGIGDLAVNWKTREIWVGTGEANSSRSSYAGLGMYKSSDNGKSWTWLGLPESQHIGRVMLHPTDPQTAWVAVLGRLYSPNRERGVYMTTDGGKTWTQTLYIDDNTGVVEMEINPASPNILYAAAWYRTRRGWNFEEAGATSGIYRSEDGGKSWKRITVAGSGFPASDSVGRIGIAVSHSNPRIVYAVVDNNHRLPDTARRDTSRLVLKDLENISKEQFLSLDDKKLERFLRSNQLPSKYTAGSVKQSVREGKIPATALHTYLYDANTALLSAPVIGCEVYRSDDGGDTWKKTNTKPLQTFFTYGYYFGKIYVSPVNPEKIAVLGVYADLSTDGGRTFSRMDKGNTHLDWHSLWFNPKKDSHIIAGNDGGLNITYDDGKNWFKANTPSVGQFYAIAVDNPQDSTYHVYGGLQDNGTWMGPSTYRESIDWIDNGQYGYKSLGGGDGMQVQVDPRNRNIVFVGYQFGNYMRRNLQTNERMMIKPAPELGETPLRFNWQSPILLSSHNPEILYFGANKLYRSMNQGKDYQAISPDLTAGPRVGDVPFGTLTTISESPLRFGLIYTGSDDGMVYVTRDGGTTWNRISDALPKGLYISRVVASRFVESRVYVTVNGYRQDHFNPYLFVSDDYGTTWRPLGGDLPLEPINVIKEDPVSDKILYVGTDGGLYASVDGGITFMNFQKGMPRGIPVHDLAIHEKMNELVVGTHGRSLYVVRLHTVQKLIGKP